MKVSDIKKLMKRKVNTYKGQSGKVLVIGGSVKYVGAVALASISALRAGCDIVRVAAPEHVAWAVNCLYPDIITLKLQGDYIEAHHLRRLKFSIEWCDVMLIGNGMGIKSTTQRFCRKLIRKYPQKLKVIDADAIRAISFGQLENAVVTAHKGEFEHLLKNSKLKKLDGVGSNVVVLKGRTDTIFNDGKTIKVKGGNPGLAKAGTGDVLAGLVTGFLAQTRDKVKSANAACVLNNKLGDLLYKKKKYAFIASDLVNEVERFAKR